TAPGRISCWSTSHIVLIVAGAARGVEKPRKTLTSSGPARRLLDTPRLSHSSRERRAPAGSEVALMSRNVGEGAGKRCGQDFAVGERRLWRGQRAGARAAP